MVRWAGYGRCGVEPRGVLEEPRPAAELGGGAEVLCRGQPASEEVYERRALHDGWRADRAWASQKSFRSKDGGDDKPKGDFHGEKCSNHTHRSTTNADALLYKEELRR